MDCLYLLLPYIKSMRANHEVEPDGRYRPRGTGGFFPRVPRSPYSLQLHY